VKVLYFHNYYQIAGGEDGVLAAEVTLLQDHNDDSSTYSVNNDQIGSMFQKVKAAVSVSFSFSQFNKIKRKLSSAKPDVVHVHNYFPVMSPSIFYACKSSRTPVVHTLHNYRAVCPTALLMHDGKVNERSINASSWWAVSKKVYRGSFLGTLALTFMVELHKKIGTWQTKVDRYIALTEFSRNKYIEAGWPAHKIAVKPNFIQDPFDGDNFVAKAGGYGLFVGRLSEEKGVDILFESWANTTGKLKVIGDGPLKEYVESKSSGSIEFLGRKDKSDVLDLVKNADFIIMPSTWYEGFPMVLVEAFACGTPALVSRLGSMEEIVEDGVTGLHFEAGNTQDLAEKAQRLIDNPERAREMGQNARNEYLAKYTPEKNYEILMDIYKQAIDEAKKTQ
jgi:glycosyltransferase involved in cell wall biosynthesis